MTDDPAPSPETDDSLRNSRFGWWSLLVFLSLGITLEALHGFKIGWYLDVSNETRRLMWTLAHSHGALLAMLNILFGLTLRAQLGAGCHRLAGSCLMGATILLPGGFFLGGWSVHGGDPGIGVLLVPPGALLLLVAVFLTARSLSRRP